MALTEYYVTDAGAGDGSGSSEANAMSFATFTDYMVTGGTFTAAPGDRFNVIGAITSRTTTTDTWVNGGTVTSPVIVRGMAAGGTLGYQGRTAGAGLVTTNMPTITYTTGKLVLSGTFILLEALNITGAPNGYTLQLGASCAAKSCVVTNTGTGASAGAISLTNSSSAVLFDCDVTMSGASGGVHAVLAAGASQRVIANRIKGGPTNGIVCRSSPVIALNTIFGCGGMGIAMDTNSGGPTIFLNSVVTSTGDGIDIVTGSTLLQFLFGNMITDGVANGLDMVSTGNAAFAAYNRFRDNATSITNGGDWLTATKYGDVDSGATGTPATDYNNYAGNDYRLVTGASPSPAVSTAQPASLSIGALQPAQPASSGGGSFAFLG